VRGQVINNMTLNEKEDNLARMLNILGFPVYPISKKDWNWIDEHFASNPAVIERHSMVEPARALLKELMVKEAKADILSQAR
tara:strand:- start:502 stop:747 length:246 start_codon:yes stop_codon:yes gene_type:complete